MSNARSTEKATVPTVSGTVAAPTSVDAALSSSDGVMVAATPGNKHNLTTVNGDNGDGEPDGEPDGDGDGDGEGNGTVVGEVSKDGGLHEEEADQENDQGQDDHQAPDLGGKQDGDVQQVAKDGEASESFDAVSG